MGKTEPKKIAIVTGANRGLGLAASQNLSKKGFEVWMLGRKKAVIEKIAASVPDAKAFECDLSDSESIARFSKLALKEEKPIDVLINNAGVFVDSKDQEKPEAILLTFTTNTMGPFLLSKALLPLLKKSKNACIVNVSSGMGGLTEMNGGYAAYRMSKTALNAVTRILHDECEGSSVKVNSVCPGWVKTDMGGAGASRSIEKGVSGILWAATLPKSGPSGGFYRDGERIDW
jgi:NAD(P)-dependent dehydrogenase (short-subunit alcohol dehydrogenase family)